MTIRKRQQPITGSATSSASRPVEDDAQSVTDPGGSTPAPEERAPIFTHIPHGYYGTRGTLTFERCWDKGQCMETGKFRSGKTEVKVDGENVSDVALQNKPRNPGWSEASYGEKWVWTPEGGGSAVTATVGKWSEYGHDRGVSRDGMTPSGGGGHREAGAPPMQPGASSQKPTSLEALVEQFVEGLDPEVLKTLADESEDSAEELEDYRKKRMKVLDPDGYKKKYQNASNTPQGQGNLQPPNPYSDTSFTQGSNASSPSSNRTFSPYHQSDIGTRGEQTAGTAHQHGGPTSSSSTTRPQSTGQSYGNPASTDPRQATQSSGYGRPASDFTSPHIVQDITNGPGAISHQGNTFAPGYDGPISSASHRYGRIQNLGNSRSRQGDIYGGKGVFD